MTNIIALTQFVFIALGTMAVNILAKIASDETVMGQSATTLRGFLANHGVWLLMIPVAWTVFAHASALVGKGYFRTRIAHPIGIALIVGIFVVYGYAIFS